MYSCILRPLHQVAWDLSGFGRFHCTSDAHGAEVGFGVGADVGEAGGIGHVRGLAGFGVGPAFALLEFYGVIVQQLIDWHRRQH